jgi:hypothetical protein
MRVELWGSIWAYLLSYILLATNYPYIILILTLIMQNAWANPPGNRFYTGYLSFTIGMLYSYYLTDTRPLILKIK